MIQSIKQIGHEPAGETRNRLESLEFLVNSSPIILYTRKTSGEFAVTFVSEGSRTVLGYAPYEFLGDENFWLNHIHPDDVERFVRGMISAVEVGHHSHEYRFRTKCGEYRWMYDELRLVQDSVGDPMELAGHCVDVTGRKRTETTLRESRARLELIFNGTSDLQMLARVEPGRRFIVETVNRAFIEQFRLSAKQNLADFIGRDLGDLLSATGLSANEIEQRTGLYEKAAKERTPICFSSPQTPLREAGEVTIYPVIDQHGVCTHLFWNARVVGERLRAEAALRNSLERYSLVTEATRDGIWDHDLISGRVFYSARYKEMLGFREDELLGDISSFFERIHPDDECRIREAANSFSQDKTKKRFSNDFRMQHKDGTYRWVTSNGRILRDDQGKPTRIAGAINDVTERYRAADRLKASEKRLYDILDALFGFVKLYTLDGTLIYTNRALLEAAGVEAKDVLGKPFWETHFCSHSPQEQARARQAIAAAARGEVVRYEASRSMRGGRRLTVDSTFGPLRDESGEICNIISFGIDITSRKEIEANLHSAKQIAEAASRAKSEFLANMSHEIRTPMNGIIGLAEVLLDSDLNPEQSEYLGLIKSSAESLLKIINDILDMAKIQSGKFVLNPKEFWLSDVIKAIAGDFIVTANHKQLQVVSHIDEELPTVVLGDPNSLRQVLGNLLDNAIKFSSTGEIVLTAEHVPDDPKTIHFSVEDTGIGIPPEKHHTIFEPFSQVDGSSHREYGGTGLGLAISAQLVVLMGGSMWVESDGKNGSSFHFTACLPSANTNDLFSTPKISPLRSRLSNKTSLGGGAERRRDPRIETTDTASMEMVRPFSAFPVDVRILDVSKSGLKLSTPEFMDPGTIVKVHLRQETFSAEVRYCVPNDKHFHAGLRLCDEL